MRKWPRVTARGGVLYCSHFGGVVYWQTIRQSSSTSNIFLTIHSLFFYRSLFNICFHPLVPNYGVTGSWLIVILAVVKVTSLKLFIATFCIDFLIRHRCVVHSISSAYVSVELLMRSVCSSQRSIWSVRCNRGTSTIPWCLSVCMCVSMYVCRIW